MAEELDGPRNEVIRCLAAHPELLAQLEPIFISSSATAVAAAAADHDGGGGPAGSVRVPSRPTFISSSSRVAQQAPGHHPRSPAPLPTSPPQRPPTAAAAAEVTDAVRAREELLHLRLQLHQQEQRHRRALDALREELEAKMQLQRQMYDIEMAALRFARVVEKKKRDAAGDEEEIQTGGPPGSSAATSPHPHSANIHSMAVVGGHGGGQQQPPPKRYRQEDEEVQAVAAPFPVPIAVSTSMARSQARQQQQQQGYRDENGAVSRTLRPTPSLTISLHSTSTSPLPTGVDSGRRAGPRAGLHRSGGPPTHHATTPSHEPHTSVLPVDPSMASGRSPYPFSADGGGGGGPTPSGPAQRGSAAPASSGRKRLTPKSPSQTYADLVATASSSSRHRHQHQHQHQQPAGAVSPPAPLTPSRAAPQRLEAVRRFITQHHHGAPLPATSTRPPQQRAAYGDAVVAVEPAPRQPPRGHETAATGPSRSQTTASTATAPGGPTRSPSPLDPQRGPTQPRRFVFTGLPPEEVRELEAAVATLGADAAALPCELDAPPPLETTHIVLRGTPRSVKALCGLVGSRWLVPPEYILRSRDAGYWLEEAREGAIRLTPPPLQLQRFVVAEPHPFIREKLVQVIEYGGGEIIWGTTTQNDAIVIQNGDDIVRYVFSAGEPLEGG